MRASIISPRKVKNVSEDLATQEYPTSPQRSPQGARSTTLETPAVESSWCTCPIYVGTSDHQQWLEMCAVQ